MDAEPDGFNNYLPDDRPLEPWSRLRATIFGITYALIFIGCIVASGASNNWSGGSIAFGVVWGALCLPGWGIIYSFMLDVNDKWL